MLDCVVKLDSPVHFEFTVKVPQSEVICLPF